MCWVQIVVAIVIAIVGELLRPKAKGNTSRPAGLGDFQFPTAEAGRVFPWIAGTVKVLGPNTTASGLLHQVESYDRVKTGWFSSAKQSYGWRYYMSFQQVICGGPIDDVLQVQVQDKPLKVAQKIVTADYIDMVIDDKGFYGDEKKDGGFAGTIRFWRGTATQTFDDVLAEVLAESDGTAQSVYSSQGLKWFTDPSSAPLPPVFTGDGSLDSAVEGGISAYRYVCYAMFRDFYIGMSVNPQPFTPIVSRWPNSLGIAGGKHIINETASNVICAAYDLLTDKIRGMGVSSAEVDTAAFLAAAETCFTEQIGVNVNVDGNQSGEDALDSIMAYADGKVFQDPFTSLWTVKLARADYDIDSLLVLDESNSRVTGRTKTDWPDTKNVITIAYLDKNKNWTNQSVQVFDSANLNVLGQTINSATLEYPGIDNAALANYIAERARAATATPFTKLQIESNGVGLRLKLNDVFVASYPTTKRIDKMVMRITDIHYGNGDDAVTTIEAIEDKFGVKFVAYTEIPDTVWNPPSNLPLPALSQRLLELPYGMTPNLDAGRYVMTIGVRAGSVETGYDVLDTVAGKVTNKVGDLTSAGQLVGAISSAGLFSNDSQAGGITIDNIVDADDILSALATEYAIGTSMLLIGNELFAFQNATDNGDGTMTFWPWTKACYDTIPEDHADGDPVYVLSSGVGLVQDTPLAADGLKKYKLLMRAGGNVLDQADAVEMQITASSRAQRPYLPANVQVNGGAIQALATATGALVITWAERNRLASKNNIVKYNAASVSPESTVRYVLQFYNSVGTLLIQKTDVDGTTATAILNYTGSLRMVLYAKSDTFDSFNKYDVTFDYTPPAGTTDHSINAGSYTPDEYVLDGGGA